MHNPHSMTERLQPPNTDRIAAQGKVLKAKDEYNRAIEDALRLGLNIKTRAEDRGHIDIVSITVDVDALPKHLPNY